MLETIKNAWKVKELRNKILFTILIIVIFRIGSVIPVPYINVEMLRASETNEFFNYLSILTGGGLEYGAIFAMSESAGRTFFHKIGDNSNPTIRSKTRRAC